MKKLTTTFLTACMIAQLMLLPVSANEKYIYKDNVKANNMPERIMLSDFCNNSRLQSDGSGYVLAISEDDLYNVEVPDETLALSLNNFLEDNGIVLLYTDSKWTSNVFDELLDLPVCADLQIEQPTDAVDEPGVDVATLYYRKNGKVATHTLNVSNSTEIDVDPYIDELIAKTASVEHGRPTTYTVSAIPDKDTPKCTWVTTKSYSIVREPYGKVTVDYDFYTANNFQAKNFFLIYPTIEGNSGFAMRKTSGNSNYDAQYKAKSLAAKVSTSTSFASITDYSPKRTIGETDVGYTISLQIGSGDSAISIGNTFTKKIYDTKVTVSKGTNSVNWNSTYSGTAKEAASEFCPAIMFATDSNKTSIQTTGSLDYTVTDGGLAGIGATTKTLSDSRTFTFNLSSVS